MFPVLFSLGKLSVSSFGLFLGLGFIFGMFLIWRLSRAWDLDEESILDLTLLTFFGGLIGSRIYFILSHPALIAGNFFNILLIQKVPGFSFWGAILGGWLTLFFVTRAKKIDFAQIGDIAAVGFLGSLIFASIGCFFGGCNVGVKSQLFFAVNMVGMVGKRFPTQLLEGGLYLIALLNLWSAATHFHTKGKILSLSLIYIGLIKFFTIPLKQTTDGSQILSLVLMTLGMTMFYKVTKRSPIVDLRVSFLNILNLFKNPAERKLFFTHFKKYWYNRKTSFFWKVRNLKKILKRINVRFS